MNANYWHDEMTEETARQVLGDKYFDFAVSQGKAFCLGRAGGSWQANLQESFGAYKTAEKHAQA